MGKIIPTYQTTEWEKYQANQEMEEGKKVRQNKAMIVGKYLVGTYLHIYSTYLPYLLYVPTCTWFGQDSSKLNTNTNWKFQSGT
jgi:hypothetical protein